MDFRKYFEYNGKDPVVSYRIFFNETSLNYEIVSRSGDIVAIIPCPVWASPDEHLEIAKNMIYDFQNGLMLEYDDELMNRLICGNELDRIADQVGFLALVDYMELPVIPYTS